MYVCICICIHPLYLYVNVIHIYTAIQKERVKTNLPDLPSILMQILKIIHELMFSTSFKSMRPASTNNDNSAQDVVQNELDIKSILIADEDDFHKKQHQSSMLEYHVLSLLYKLLYYSTPYSRQHSKSKINDIISKMILKRFKIIVKILKSKHSMLKTKTLCIKMIRILFETHTKPITDILVKVKLLLSLFKYIFFTYIVFVTEK